MGRQLIVVDIGNTRVKWGRCDDASVVEAVSIRSDHAAWNWQAEQWADRLPQPTQWVIAGVVPKRVEEFREWVNARGDQCRVIDSYKQLDMKVELPQPEKVGIDRLLNALAAFRFIHPENQEGIIIDAGSAITIDLIIGPNSFLGGAILPGFRLMSHALNSYTAQLPVVEFLEPDLPNLRAWDAYPATDTESAIRVGIWSAIHGCITQLCRRHPLQPKGGDPVRCILTGGDGPMLKKLLVLSPTSGKFNQSPTLTLEGIRIVAEALP